MDPNRQGELLALLPYILIALMITLTVAVIVRVLLPALQPRRIMLPAQPDTPKAFGPSMAWIAIRNAPPERIAHLLGVEGATAANWDAGIGAIYDEALSDTHIFIAPPVKGITFVAGVPLPMPVGRAFADKLTPLLTDLAAQFRDVQYFACFPAIDFYAWTRFENGRVVRAFAMSEEGVIWDRGRLTAEERALGLRLFELRGIRGRSGDAGGAIILHPTEGQVLRMACGWSLDPSLLDKLTCQPATGIVARAPAAWRSERVRKAAA